MTMSSLALKITKAKKIYNKKVHALKGIDLEVPSGEFFGLLGPNGAGKTTLIQSIVGLSRLTEGDVSVFDHDVVKEYKLARSLIGYSPQEVNLDRFFSIQKILEFQAGFFGKSRKEQKQIVERLLDQFGLSEKAGVQFYKLSGGMQKRVLIAKALVSDPRLLILDEPTAGVDVEKRHELWGILRKLNQQGTTIILTTHYIDEAEALCERIGIINLGEIKELDSPKKLIETYCKPKVKILTNQPLSVQDFSVLSDLDVYIEGNRVCAVGGRAGVMTERILQIILAIPGVSVQDISISQGTLEDVFIKITGSALTAGEAA